MAKLSKEEKAEIEALVAEASKSSEVGALRAIAQLIAILIGKL